MGVQLGEQKEEVFRILQERFPESELSERSDAEASLSIEGSRVFDHISMDFHPDGRIHDLAMFCRIPFEMAVKYVSERLGEPTRTMGRFAIWSLRGGKYEVRVSDIFFNVAIGIKEIIPEEER